MAYSEEAVCAEEVSKIVKEESPGSVFISRKPTNHISVIFDPETGEIQAGGLRAQLTIKKEISNKDILKQIKSPGFKWKKKKGLGQPGGLPDPNLYLTMIKQAEEQIYAFSHHRRNEPGAEISLRNWKKELKELLDVEYWKRGNGIKEGTAIRRTVIQYFRDRKKRKEAIQKYGNSCIFCGWNADLEFGKEVLSGYIQTHHLTPVSQLNGRTTEQFPFCPNCHAFVDSWTAKNSGREMSLAELEFEYRRLLKNKFKVIKLDPELREKELYKINQIADQIK